MKSCLKNKNLKVKSRRVIIKGHLAKSQEGNHAIFFIVSDVSVGSFPVRFSISLPKTSLCEPFV